MLHCARMAIAIARNVNLQTREMVRSTSRTLSYTDLLSLIDDVIATAVMNYVTEAREALLALGEKVELPMQIQPLGVFLFLRHRSRSVAGLFGSFLIRRSELVAN